MADGDLSVTIESNTGAWDDFDSWAVVTIEGWSAKAGTVTYANQADRYDFSKLSIAVTSEGYDGSTLTTKTRNLVGTKALNKVYPNESEILEVVSGSDLQVWIALSEEIYSDDKNGGAGTSGTDPVFTFTAGFATDGADESNAGVITATNNSTLDYPKVIAQWDLVSLRGSRRRMTDDFNVSVFAAGNYGLSQVTLSAIGATSANSVSNNVTSATASSFTVSGLYAPAYQSATALSGFTQGEKINLRFIAYPNIGDADSVVDSNDDNDTNNRCLLKSQEYVYCDKDQNIDGNGHISAGMVSSKIAFCNKDTGNNATGVVGTAAAAAANMYEDHGEAIKDGADVVYIQNSTAVPNLVAGWGNNRGVDYYIEVMEDPNDTGVYLSRNTASDDNYRQKLYCYTNIELRQTSGSGWLDGEGGDRRLLFDGCYLNTSSSSNVGLGYQSKDCTFINCTGLGGDSYNSQGATTNAYIFQGNQWGSGGGGGNSVYSAIGNASNGQEMSFFGKSTSNTAPAQTNNIIANNEMFDKTVNGTNTECIHWGDNEDIEGLLIAGNIFECSTEVASGPLLWIAGDGNAVEIKTLMLVHNTWVGQRINGCYSDLGSAVNPMANVRYIGNAGASQNIKGHDYTLTPDGARIGNRPQLFGVGWRWNKWDSSVSATFKGEYYGVDSSYEINDDIATEGELGFVNEKSAVLVTNAGSPRDYTPDTGSVLTGASIPADIEAIWPIDLYGNSFDGTYVGAVANISSGGGSGSGEASLIGGVIKAVSGQLIG